MPALDETTAETLTDAAVEIASGKVQSSTVDGRSATAIDPIKLLEIANKAAATATLRNTGGAWGSALRSRSVPPGSV